MKHRIFKPEVWSDLVTAGYERHEILEEFSHVPHQVPVLYNDWLTPAEIDA
jgi:hypothetical protein